MFFKLNSMPNLENKFFDSIDTLIPIFGMKSNSDTIFTNEKSSSRLSAFTIPFPSNTYLIDS